MNDMISERFRAERKRRRAKAALFVPLFIIIGGVIGAGAAFLWMSNRSHRAPPRRDAVVARMLERMRERVDVSADEEKRLGSLLESHFDEILAVREQSYRSMRDVFRRMDADVEKVIGAARFKIWNEYKERRMERWRQRYERK